MLGNRCCIALGKLAVADPGVALQCSLKPARHIRSANELCSAIRCLSVPHPALKRIDSSSSTAWSMGLLDADRECDHISLTHTST